MKALAATSTTPPPELSVEAVMEDFSWFDCPGLKVTEVEDGLQVDVEDRQLGLAAMEGLKHKYLITQQVWNSSFQALISGCSGFNCGRSFHRSLYLDLHRQQVDEVHGHQAALPPVLQGGGAACAQPRPWEARGAGQLCKQGGGCQGSGSYLAK